MSLVCARHRGPRPLRTWLLALTLLPGCDRGSAPPEGSDPPAAPADPQAPQAPSPAPEATPPEPPAAPLPPAEELLDRAAVAMGGRQAIDTIQSFHYRGTIEMLGQNIRGDLRIWWKGGDFYMEQIVPGIGEMRAGKQGDRIWADDPVNGRRRLTGIEAEQHTWASSLLLAADWKRYFDEAQTIAEREVDGHRILDVRLSSATGLEVTMSFDADTGLQVGQSFEQVTPMGRQPFDVTFEDYRDVDGIKIAFRQVIDAKFQKIVQVIEEVELNAAVDEGLFAQPGSADVVRRPSAARGG